jgi:hypothetical protein
MHVTDMPAEGVFRERSTPSIVIKIRPSLLGDDQNVVVYAPDRVD